MPRTLASVLLGGVLLSTAPVQAEARHHGYWALPLVAGGAAAAAILAARPREYILVPPAGPLLYSSQPPVFIQRPPAPVCYEHGCYYLRGDGLHTPYYWEWVWK